MRRKFIVIIILVCLSSITKGQNTGIGIATPRAKLHVFNGASGNNAPYSPLVVESNSHTYINLLSPEANETSILFGKPSNAASGGIMYNAAATPNGLQFRTNGNDIKMVIRDNGNVGIGTVTPNAPLGFSQALGKKITLYPSTPGDYGFGIQASLLQIYTDNSNADIAFGYDNGSNFVERFRMKGNGAFAVNGSAGSPGQVLQTNGDALPTWSNSTNLLYSNTIMLESSASIALTTNDLVTLPGLSHTFSVASSTKVLTSVSIYAYPGSCVGCGATQLSLWVLLDGVNTKFFRVDLPNGFEQTIAGSLLLQVAPGSHTISIAAIRSGPNVYLGAPSPFASHAILQIIPQ